MSAADSLADTEHSAGLEMLFVYTRFWLGNLLMVLPHTCSSTCAALVCSGAAAQPRKRCLPEVMRAPSGCHQAVEQVTKNFCALCTHCISHAFAVLGRVYIYALADLVRYVASDGSDVQQLRSKR